MGSAPQVFVSGSFDDLRSRQVRLLEEAAQWGPLHVLLWSDRSAARLTGKTPKFPEAERLYLVGAIRYVNQVTLVEPTHADALPCSAPKARFGPSMPPLPRPPSKRTARLGGSPTGPSPRNVWRSFPRIAARWPQPRRSVRGDRHRLLRLVPLRTRAVLRGSGGTGRSLRHRGPRCQHPAAQGRRAPSVFPARAMVSGALRPPRAPGIDFQRRRLAGRRTRNPSGSAPISTR